MYKKYLMPSLIGSLFMTSLPVYALNCTAAQKKEADRQLKTIAADVILKEAIQKNHMPFGLHESQNSPEGEAVLYQGGYIMLHDEDLKTSLWSSFRLSKNDRLSAKGKPRINCFRTDPRLKKSKSAVKSDYNESIYDQGHLANDASLKDNLIEQLNTYVMSNMSPQYCRFNRGIWLSLEGLVRTWASEGSYEDIYVTSGAIFDRDNQYGRDLDVDARRMESRNNAFRVGVPSHYYKVILRRDGIQWHSVSFLLEHSNSQHGTNWLDVRTHTEASIVTLEEIEAKASIHLHPLLERTKLKQYSEGQDWDFSKSENNLEKSVNTYCVATKPH